MGITHGKPIGIPITGTYLQYPWRGYVPVCTSTGRAGVGYRSALRYPWDAWKHHGHVGNMQGCIQHPNWHENDCKNSRSCQHTQKNKQKSPNLPTGIEIWHTGEVDSLWNAADVSIICTDMQSDEKYLKSRAKTSESVKRGQNGKAHFIDHKLKYPSVLDNGDTSTLNGSRCTHPKTCQLKP